MQITVNFSCLVRANDIINGQNELKLLKAIGLKYVYVGIESFIQSHLDLYNKKITVSENINALHILDDLDLQPNIGFMLFNPITTVEDLLNTIDIFKNINFNSKHKYCLKPISFSPVVATEGSPFYNYVHSLGIDQVKSPFYHFLDPLTEKCFEILKKWFPKVIDIYKYSILDTYVEIQKNEELRMQVRNLMFSLFWLDLDFLQYICEKIKAGIELEENFMDDWNIKLERMKYKLDNIEKLVEKTTL